MRRIPFITGLFLLVSSLASTAGAQTTIIVPSLSAPTIQDGIDDASSGDTVLVSPGTYFETLVIFDKSITLDSTGGRNQTIVDASGTGRVLTLARAAGTTIRGFTFTDGLESSGGGVGVFTPNVTIEACAITNNVASGVGNGGGVWVQQAAGMVIDSTLITNNSASGSGGGILAAFSDLTISDSDISFNTAGGDGGGVWIEGGSHLIEGSELRLNQAADGAGLYVIEAEMTLFKSQLLGNIASGEGGGVEFSFPLGAGYQIHESTIADNQAGSGGGGILGRVLGDALTVRSTMLTGNSAGSSGGGMAVIGSGSGTVTIRESTFSDNSAGFFGGALSISDSSATVESSILWNDSAVMGGDEISVAAGFAVSASFSDVDPAGFLGTVVVGAGMINADPAFAAPLIGDYRQTVDSPTLDAGSLAPPPGALDFECDPRWSDSDNDGVARVDIGADECPFLPGDVNCDGSLNIADPLYLLAYLFQGGPPPVCSSGDVNGDGSTSIVDPSFLFAYLFQGGPAPICQG